MTRFGTNDSVLVRTSFFDYGGGRNPQFPDFEATFSLIFFRMLKMEKLGRFANVIVVQMREGYHVEKIAICFLEILSQFFPKWYPQVLGVVFAAYVCVVEENFLAVRQVNQTTVGVSQRIECEPVHGRGPPQTG
jgi:hypothetical protein